MKRLLIIVFCIVSGCAYSQYIPGSAQPFQLAPLFNPAFTGIENFNDFKFAYRYQWAAFKENAPQFANLSYTVRIKHPLDLKVNSIRTSRSDFTRIVPKIRLNVQGLGFNVFSDEYGPMKRYGGGLHYAIHIPLSEKIFISTGVGGAVEMTRLNGDELNFGENPDPDPYMDRLKNGTGNHTELWTRVGVLLYGEHFYIGGAYFPYHSTLTKSEVAFNDPFYKGNFQAGLSFNLNEDFVVKPSVFALLQASGGLSIDYSAKFYLQDRAWFGLTYRDVKSGIGSTGFHINEKVSVSYSFEFSMGPLRTFTGSSHDLVLAIRFKNLKRVNQYTW
jgi:type IX secretion system PorP/SprF family membrane protein